MALIGNEKEMSMPPVSTWSSQTLDDNSNINNTPNQDQLPDNHRQDHTDTFQPMPISVGYKLDPPTRYRECLKNHAVTIGGNVTDGCGEFMPMGNDGTLEALKCAACNCHRNFHRRVTSDFSRTTAIHSLPPPLPSPNRQRNIRALAIHSKHWTSSHVSPVKIMTCGSASATTESSSEELNFNAHIATAPHRSLKKRFRTKFTYEQKEKMMEFAERGGWRIPRENDAEVQRFCDEIGVKRQVFKVWMHNNKSSYNISGSAHVVTASSAEDDFTER